MKHLLVLISLQIILSLKKVKGQWLSVPNSQEKYHVIVLLVILANGGKLPPLLIINGVANGKINNDFKKNFFVKINKIFLECNSNAWCTKDIMFRWSNSIWGRNIESFNKEAIPSLLIMDQFTMHANDIVIKEIESKDTEIKFISKGMTGVLQPLDVNVDKAFKVYIKKRYIKYCYEKKNSIEKVSRDLFY